MGSRPDRLMMGFVAGDFRNTVAPELLNIGRFVTVL